MSYSALDYKELLKKLLPRGRAWTRDESSDLVKFLYALAEEFSRIDSRSNDMVIESRVTTTEELISEHEIDFGISPDENLTLEERRNQLLTKQISIGRQNVEYFEDIASALGYTIEIEEFKPAWAGVMQAGDPCGDYWVIFYFLVKVLINRQLGEFESGQFGEGFNGTDLNDINVVFNMVRAFWDLIIEIDFIKQAHLHSLYDFYGSAFSKSFYWSFDAFPFDDQTSPISQFNYEFGNGYANIKEYDGQWLIGPFDYGFTTDFNRHSGGGYSTENFDISFRVPR